MITRYFNYPWGEYPVEFDLYILKRIFFPREEVYCNSGETLIEYFATTQFAFKKFVEKIESERQIHLYDNGYKEYHKWCFEYPTKDEKGREGRMLVYLFGFLKNDD